MFRRRIVFLFTAFLIIGAILLSACNEFGKGSTVDVTVSNTQLYKYDFGICGDEDGVSITTMAEHYTICSIVRDSTTNFCSYLYYQPSAGYTGADYIEVETIVGSNGANGGTVKTIGFNITVTN